MNDDARRRSRHFILEEFLPGEDPESLTDDTAAHQQAASSTRWRR